MTDLEQLQKIQPALLALCGEVPYLRLVSDDLRRVADAEFRSDDDAERGALQIAVVEYDASGAASPVMAAVFDAASGALVRSGLTVSQATAPVASGDEVAMLAEVIRELVACPATAGP